MPQSINDLKSLLPEEFGPGIDQMFDPVTVPAAPEKLQIGPRSSWSFRFVEADYA